MKNFIFLTSEIYVFTSRSMFVAGNFFQQLWHEKVRSNSLGLNCEKGDIFLARRTLFKCRKQRWRLENDYKGRCSNNWYHLVIQYMVGLSVWRNSTSTRCLNFFFYSMTGINSRFNFASVCLIKLKWGKFLPSAASVFTLNLFTSLELHASWCLPQHPPKLYQLFILQNIGFSESTSSYWFFEIQSRLRGIR